MKNPVFPNMVHMESETETETVSLGSNCKDRSNGVQVLHKLGALYYHDIREVPFK